MSAFVCSPEHLAALAIYMGGTDPIHAVEQLFRVNYESVRARYAHLPIRDTPGLVGGKKQTHLEQAQQFVRVFLSIPPDLNERDLANMAFCYEYQSNEKVKMFERTSAGKAVRKLQEIGQFGNAVSVTWEFEAHKHYLTL